MRKFSEGKKKHLASMSNTQEECESRKEGGCLWRLEEGRVLFSGVHGA